MKGLNVRFGHAKFKQVKSILQIVGESLQEFGVDVTLLVRFAYLTVPEDIIECLVVCLWTG